MGYVLGIDLGTTWSAAAVGREGHVEACTLGTTAPAIPSVVLLREDGEILTGEAADRRSMSEPTRTAREFKRRLGDPVPIIVGGTPYGAESLMAHLLRAIVADVSEREGGPPDMVVLTHPANYTDYKQGLLSEAARLAGFPPARVRLIAEPAAAAVAYARQQRVESGDVVAVYDFGGGTFDAALVRKTDIGFELIGTPEGMERLGGIDIDQAVFAHVNAATDGMIAAADSSDPQVRTALARLREECRKAKEALSTDTDTVISVSLPNLQTEVRLTREELEGMIRPRIGETIDALLRAVDSSGVPRDQVSRVLLVGGSSRMPIVGQLVRELTGRPVAVDAHPKLAIATGAASLMLEQPDAGVVVEPVAGPIGGSGAGGIAAAAGVGFAATAAGGAILGVGAAPAAASAGASGAAVGVGPAGVAVGPTGVAGAGVGPTGVAGAGVGPTGVAGPGVGPGGTAHGGHVATGAKTAVKGGRRIGVILGAGAGAVVAVGALAVVATRGGNQTASTGTTVTTVVSAGGTSPATTVAPTGARGLTGVVSIVAGNGTDDGTGVPGPASDVSLGSKMRYAVASNGDIFLTNGTVNVLKLSGGQVSVFGQIDAVEGLGTGVAIGPDGSVFVATPSTVRKFTTDGNSTVILKANEAGLTTSLGPITVDGAGNVYVVDGSRRITRIGTDGSTSLVAGTGTQAPSNTAAGDGGPAIASPLGVPTQLLIDRSGNLLFADSASRRVRRVSSDGTITTIAGGGTTKLLTTTGKFAPDGTKATDLDLADASGVAVDGKGRIYVADPGSGAIVRFGTDGGLELVIADQQGGPQTAGNPANATRARNPGQLTVDAQGNLLYFDAAILWRIAGAGS